MQTRAAARPSAPQAEERSLPQKKRESVGARSVDLQREQLVGARAAEIDGRDGFAELRHRCDEAVARVHHQRRADDQHGVGVARARRTRAARAPAARVRRRTRRRASAARRRLRSSARRTPRSRRLEFRVAVGRRSAPRGPRTRGCARTSSCCMCSRGVRRSQLMQRTTSTRPCRSMTLRLPAAWCRPSTFCVTSCATRPSDSSAASARWASFGSAALHAPPADEAARPVALAPELVVQEVL